MRFKSSFTIPAVAAISFCLIGGTTPAAADILHVPGDFPTIQEAIDAAMDGDEVEVHPGTYNENINFLGKAIRVYSTDGRDVTIIDAQQTGTVVTCDSAEGPDSVLDGFTVTGGEPSGMRNVGSSPMVTDCTFSENTAFGGGGFGGGMVNFNSSSPTVINCTFSGNSVDDGGGGMANSNSSPTVTNCTFSGNTVSGPFGGGGGMFNGNSSPTLTNCTFTGNAAGFTDGGGMFNDNSSPTVTNCTFSGNSATNGNALAFDFGPSELTMTNCILWDGGNEIWNNDGSTITIGYTDVQGGWPGTGNIDADPMFVAPGNGDLRLMPGSPCIDAADNTAVPKGIITDLDGNPRFVDDPDTKDTGNGDPPIVDMGAYEFQAMDCPWDVNGDGVVDRHDLLEVVHNLGRCDDPDNCPWDVNGDGIVNGRDVAAVATHFGSCP